MKSYATYYILAYCLKGGESKSFPTRDWQLLNKQQAILCFLKHFIKANPVQSTVTDVKGTARKKIRVFPCPWRTNILGKETVRNEESTNCVW